MDPEKVSDRSRGVALALATVTGVFGGHRFYAGKTGTGLLMLCTLGGFGIWWLFDMILVASGEFRDWDERRIVRWTADSPAPASLRGDDARRILDALEDVRGDVFELQERVDFMERMLAQVKDRPRVGSGG